MRLQPSHSIHPCSNSGARWRAVVSKIEFRAQNLMIFVQENGNFEVSEQFRLVSSELEACFRVFPKAFDSQNDFKSDLKIS